MSTWEEIQIYRGDSLLRPANGLRPYLPTKKIIRAVNVAYILKRPLLVRGEPGCGKTRLAEAIAFELHQGDWNHHYHHWPIRSTTRAEAGLYTYEYTRELRDYQLNRLKDSQEYVKLGALGRALNTGSGIPEIVLIDEIDKADIDFPNDLLDVLERRSFEIIELPKGHSTRNIPSDPSNRNQPIIIITSNDEKELPNAFLRRCVCLWIGFPDPGKLQDIALANHMDTNDQWREKDLPILVQEFWKIREDMERKFHVKLPSTSEMLDWIQILRRRTEAGTKDRDILKAVSSGHIPFQGTMIKTKQDADQINNP